jgi:hypothetical protein
LFSIWPLVFDIRMSDLLTIQFRLSFKDKGHKSLEYYCLVIHLTSVISTISYPQSNGDIFIVIAPWGITNTRTNVKRSASDNINIYLKLLSQGKCCLALKGSKATCRIRGIRGCLYDPALPERDARQDYFDVLLLK